MAGPSADIGATFKAFCDTFNNAQTAKSYNGIQPFLASHVTMHKVDDPSAVSGNPSTIIAYLNGSQIGQWPQFNPGKQNPPNKGNITGSGTYVDHIGAPTIPVQYAFRFLLNNGVWLVSTATAIPT